MTNKKKRPAWEKDKEYLNAIDLIAEGWDDKLLRSLIASLLVEERERILKAVRLEKPELHCNGEFCKGMYSGYLNAKGEIEKKFEDLESTNKGGTE